MTEPEFLTVQDVLDLHDALLDEHGGQAGIRDRGLLESAVAMPAAAFDGVFLHQEPRQLGDGTRRRSSSLIGETLDSRRSPGFHRGMRFLFTACFGTGHVNPMIPLAAAARDAGHDVIFATPATHAARLGKLGFRVLPCGVSADDPRVDAAAVTGRRALPGGGTTAMGALFIDLAARQLLSELPAVMDDARPDVVVSELFEFAGPIVAEQRGLPVALFAYGAPMGLTQLDERSGGAWGRLRESAGLDGDVVRAAGRGPVLVAAPRGFAHPELAALGPFFLRPDGGDQDVDAKVDWIDALPARPTIYATLGTAFASSAPGLFEAFVDGLQELDASVIVTVGPRRDPATLGARPPHVRVERYVPQSALLPRCDLVVAHAGYGTTMGCLRAGVPMVLLPFGADQPMNAAACERLGASLTLDPKSVSPPRVRELASRVLGDPSFRAAARTAARELDAMPGPDAAVQHVVRAATR